MNNEKIFAVRGSAKSLLSDFIDRYQENQLSSIFNIPEKVEPEKITREGLNEAYTAIIKADIPKERHIFVDMDNGLKDTHNKQIETEDVKILIIGRDTYFKLLTKENVNEVNSIVKTLGGIPITQIWHEEASTMDFQDLQPIAPKKEYQGELKSNRVSKRLKKHKKWNHKQNNNKFSASGKIKRR